MVTVQSHPQSVQTLGNQSSLDQGKDETFSQDAVTVNPSLDEETLKLLGEDLPQKGSGQFILQQDIARMWNNWTSIGLEKDKLEELLKKYPRSGNCNLEAPKVNPEIGAVMSEITSKRDKHFVESQQIIGSAMVALGTTLSTLLEENEEGIDKLTLIEYLGDAGKLLSAVQFKESKTRRAFISPNIDKSLRLVIDESKPDTFLYGSDLQSKIKEAKSIEKIGSDLKMKPQEKKAPEKLAKKTLNWKSLPARGQKSSRVGNYQQRSQYRPMFAQKRPAQTQGKYRPNSEKRPPSKR